MRHDSLARERDRTFVHLLEHDAVGKLGAGQGHHPFASGSGNQRIHFAGLNSSKGLLGATKALAKPVQSDACLQCGLGSLGFLHCKRRRVSGHSMQ